jgi:hypothetical protein
MFFCQTVFASEKRPVVKSPAIMGRDFFDPTPEEFVLVESKMLLRAEKLFPTTRFTRH